MSDLTFSTKIPKQLAVLTRISICKYCDKHNLTCTILSEVHSGFLFWKKATLTFKVSGDEYAVKEADRNFRHTFMI
jgi:hypothetical protein